MTTDYEWMLRVAVFRQWEPPLPDNGAETAFVQLRGMAEATQIDTVEPGKIERAVMLREYGEYGGDEWMMIDKVPLTPDVTQCFDASKPFFAMLAGEGVSTSQKETLVLSGYVAGDFLREYRDDFLVHVAENMRAACAGEGEQ